MNIKFKADLDRLFFINFSGYFAFRDDFSDSFFHYMTKLQKITIENEYFCLNQFDSACLSKPNLKSRIKLYNIYNRASFILSLIPGVCAFSLCNSLALKTFHDNSDVDIFVILDHKSFFTTRLLIILIFNILRLRPKVCLSFFLSNKHLDLKNISLDNDIYLSHWLNSLNFVSSSADLIENFKSVNSCSSNLVKTFRFKSMPSFLENILSSYQLKRARKKQSQLANSYGVVIDRHMLKFHHRDIRKSFNPQYLLQYDEFSQGNRVKTYQQSQPMG